MLGAIRRMSLSASLDDGLGHSDQEDEDAIVLSPKQVLDRLETGWVNEKVAPELLPPLGQEKNAMMQQIKLMERNVLSLNGQDMRTEIHKLEIERIKFVVVSYMRVRLFKLHKMAVHYYDLEMKRPPHKASVVMPEELAFIKKFVSRTEEYLKAVLLSKFPQALQKFDRRKFKQPPHMHSYVFFRVREESTIEVEDSHEQTHIVPLKEGEQHVMRYQPIAKLLYTNAVYLV